jgi:hypothetical protein
VYSASLTRQVVVFDAEDAYLRRRGTAGAHPRPLVSLHVLLVAEIVGGARQDLPEPIELVAVRSARGYYAFFGGFVAADRSRRRLDLAAGTYVFRIEAAAREPIYQPVEVNVAVPAAGAVSVDLEPSYAYPFPTETLPNGRRPTLLRGAYLTPAGSGISGAIVEVVGVSNRCVTDGAGQWVLVFPDNQPSGNVTVRFQAGNAPALNVAGVPVTAGDTASLPLTALRGTVVRAGGGIEGAVVRVAGRPGETRSSVDGSWRYVFPPDQPNANVNLIAEVAGAAPQNRPNVPVQARSTQVVPAFIF